MVSKRLLEEADPTTAEGWYLNLFTWEKIKEEWGDWHPQPTTISSNVLYAFHKALRLLHEEGLEKRIRRHEIIGRAYREGLKGLGFTLFSDEKYASNTVSSARPPKGIDAMDLIKRLKEDHAISIAGTLGPMRGQGIRIGHLGTQASPEFLEPMLTALAGYARKSGVKHTEEAVDRAMQIAAKVS
jgi:aspartate aminotransferase-like enzyme